MAKGAPITYNGLPASQRGLVAALRKIRRNCQPGQRLMAVNGTMKSAMGALEVEGSILAPEDLVQGPRFIWQWAWKHESGQHGEESHQYELAGALVEELIRSGLLIWEGPEDLLPTLNGLQTDVDEIVQVLGGRAAHSKGGALGTASGLVESNRISGTIDYRPDEVSKYVFIYLIGGEPQEYGSGTPFSLVQNLLEGGLTSFSLQD